MVLEDCWNVAVGELAELQNGNRGFIDFGREEGLDHKDNCKGALSRPPIWCSLIVLRSASRAATFVKASGQPPQTKVTSILREYCSL